MVHLGQKRSPKEVGTFVGTLQEPGVLSLVLHPKNVPVQELVCTFHFISPTVFKVCSCISRDYRPDLHYLPRTEGRGGNAGNGWLQEPLAL